VPPIVVSAARGDDAGLHSYVGKAGSDTLAPGGGMLAQGAADFVRENFHLTS
jgi:hypothetical protein